jgi:hypothetical protein
VRRSAPADLVQIEISIKLRQVPRPQPGFACAASRDDQTRWTRRVGLATHQLQKRNIIYSNSARKSTVNIKGAWHRCVLQEGLDAAVSWSAAHTARIICREDQVLRRRPSYLVPIYRRCTMRINLWEAAHRIQPTPAADGDWPSFLPNVRT